jgi:XTP/dITP diphosphohydrolase
MAGSLLTAPIGENGFGYDPIFVPKGFEISTAQMSAAEKDAISHRGKALNQLAHQISEVISKH